MGRQPDSSLSPYCGERAFLWNQDWYPAWACRKKSAGCRAVGGPSAIPFSSHYKMPKVLSGAEVDELIQAFKEGARRAVEAGFDTVEIHGAHGYLIHQFHSPLTNQRSDEYGQDLPLFGERVVQAVKEVARGNADHYEGICEGIRGRRLRCAVLRGSLQTLPGCRRRYFSYLLGEKARSAQMAARKRSPAIRWIWRQNSNSAKGACHCGRNAG